MAIPDRFDRASRSRRHPNRHCPKSHSCSRFDTTRLTEIVEDVDESGTTGPPAGRLLKAYVRTKMHCPGELVIFCPTSSVDHRHRAILPARKPNVVSSCGSHCGRHAVRQLTSDILHILKIPNRVIAFTIPQSVFIMRQLPRPSVHAHQPVDRQSRIDSREVLVSRRSGPLATSSRSHRHCRLTSRSSGRSRSHALGSVSVHASDGMRRLASTKVVR